MTRHPKEVEVLKSSRQKNNSKAANFGVKISPGTWELVSASEIMTWVEKIRAERKLTIDGGDGIGPARQATSISEARKPGKPRDTLVDDLVVEVKEPKKGGSDKQQLAVYCIGCKKRTSGRDPNHIKQHAKDCTVSHREKVWCIQVILNLKNSRPCQKIS